MRPFRFGVQAARADDGARWRSLARKVEELGYQTLVVPDHFDDQFAPFPALVAAAEATERLRVGTLVIDVDFLHPVVLARDAATVDLLTDGRLELGLGAGWQTSDYTRSGIPMDPPGRRIARLGEVVRILDGLWADGPFSFEGEHFRIRDLEGHPKPAQRPRPPILIGGGGRRVLTLAARHADIVGINVDLRAGAISPELGASATAEATDRKVAWVREAAGERADDLELQVLVFAVVVTGDRRGVAEAIGSQFGGLTAEQVLEIPHFLIGTHEQIAEDLHARRERWGISYIVIQGGMSDLAPVVAELAGR